MIKEYYVEVENVIFNKRMYVQVACKSKEEARKRVYVQRAFFIHDYKKEIISNITECDFRVKRAYEYKKEIIKNKKFKIRFFGCLLWFNENEVNFI